MLDLNVFRENKNVVMCLSSLFFMFGILTFFNSHEILYCLIFTFLQIFALAFNIFDIKRILIFCFLFYFGFFLSQYKVKNYDDLLPLAPLNSQFSGRIVSIPQEMSPGRVRFFMKVRKVGDENIEGKVLVSIFSESEKLSQLNIGENIKINGSLRQPFTSTNPSQFDYSKYLRNFNTFTVLYSDSGDFEILKDNPKLKWKFLKELNNTRNKIIKVHSKYLKSPNLEILGGIVFGDDAVSAPEYIKNSFINSGLLHILAASGMNVAFIFSFWFFILRFLKVPYKTRTFTGIFVIIAYTLMTGLGASVVRAALMLIFVLLGKLIDRDSHSIALLSLVAVLMLVYNPAYINDVSFQLSFFVTFGLLTTANVFSSKLENIPNWIKIPVIIPLVAQIWVVPIQMFYFNTISLYSIFANICSVNLLSVISFLGFVSSVLAIFPPIADNVCMIFDFVNNYLLNILVWISNFFGSLPYCKLQTIHPEIYQVVIYYFMVISVTYLVKYDKFKKSLIIALASIFLLVITGIKPVSKDLEVIAFDVGNADCFLIKTPQNKYFMIDTGKASYNSTTSQAKIIVLKYLKDRGIKNLEGVIVTHFDNDHAGGVVDIIENTNVKTLYLNSYNTDTQTGINIFKAAKRINQNVNIATPKSEIYTEPNFKITNLKYNTGKKDADNESSIVTILSYKDFDMLFTGDAGVDTFEHLKQNIPSDIEVLKVGHHGGPNVVNDNMLEYLGVKVSLISTGINHFGHPNKGTLDTLRKTKIIRTDMLHSIKIKTDGKKYKIYSYDPHDKKYLLKEKLSAQK